jgi:predicted nucleic acid-binding protein
MAATVVADTGFLVGFLDRRDSHHAWAVRTGQQHPPPWRTCEAVVSEAGHILSPLAVGLVALLSRSALTVHFSFGDHRDAVLTLMEKYADVPMSFADACLVRMTEVLPEPILLTTDADFRVYRRHSRQVVPCVMPR